MAKGGGTNGERRAALGGGWAVRAGYWPVAWGLGQKVTMQTTQTMQTSRSSVMKGQSKVMAFVPSGTQRDLRQPLEPSTWENSQQGATRRSSLGSNVSGLALL
jgi:hypothetical protein